MESNKNVRKAIRIAGVKYWQVADALKISPYTLSVKLRHELPAEEQKNIVEAIKSIEGRNSNE